MTFDEYSERAGVTAVYPNRGNDMMYPTLGLCGESGEIAEKVKKMIRDDGGVLTDERRDLLKKELGDVMWYIAALCHELGFSMGEVAQENIDKLYSRMDRNKLKGDGDDR